MNSANTLTRDKVFEAPVRQAPVSLPYRPSIDGLRSIAVLSVVLFHLSPSALRGGFVGVVQSTALESYALLSETYCPPVSVSLSCRYRYTARCRLHLSPSGLL